MGERASASWRRAKLRKKLLAHAVDNERDKGKRYKSVAYIARYVTSSPGKERDAPYVVSAEGKQIYESPLRRLLPRGWRG